MIFYFYADLTDALIVEEQQFKQAKCKQTEREVQCEDIAPEKESEVSDWPPGLYSIPMPVSGCPESSNKGWREGYISITWTTSHNVYVMGHSASDSENASEISSIEAVEITEDIWSEFGTNLLGSFRKYLFRLYFCHKRGRNETVDIGAWPDGNYSIYGDATGCPAGFSSNNMTVNLGQIEYWTSGGQVPDFGIENANNSATLWMTLCTRDSIATDATNANSATDLPRTPFMLLKDGELDCPRFEESTLSGESLFLDVVGQKDTELIHVQSYCFYMPKEWNSDNYADDLSKKLEKSAYLVSTSYLLEGNRSVAKQPTGHFESILNTIEAQVQTIRYIPWKLVDLGRTMPVAAVWINLPNGAQYSSDTDRVPTCFISKAKWCFLHMCAYKCIVKAVYKTKPTALQLLFYRSMRGRYIALAAGDETNNILHLMTSIDVFTDRLKFDGKNDCNIDLGMTDGGIHDFQISASSFQISFPPSHSRSYYDGWCAQSFDVQPYIQVDLLAETTVEGLTVWNWQKTVTTMNDVIWETIVHFGVDVLKVFYGESINSLREIDQEFRFDMTRPFDEAQTFWFLQSITARFVRLKIVKPITEDLNCLRFELHGCRISGIPSLECAKMSEMFHLSNVPISSKEEFGFHNAKTFDECEKFCLHSDICSSVSFTYSNSCSIYRHSIDKQYQFYQINNDLEVWSTKLCYQDHFLTGPRLIDIQEGELANANIKEISADGIISSPEYPFSYQGGQNYKWIISFEQDYYVKLIFTNISLHIYEESTDIANSCYDSILISNDMRNSFDTARVLDSRFNGALSVIETSESMLVVTLKTCLPFSRRTSDGHGFRAIASKNSMPACFTLDSTISWETGREEICSQLSMSLTSMSLLGLPFSETTERWKINTPGQRIILYILEFQVACKTGDTGSEFFIRDLGVENSYCNLNKPPREIYSSSDTLTITFFKDLDPPFVTFKEGFRLKYDSQLVSMDYLISYQAHRSNVTNVALGKPAIMPSRYIYKSREFLAAGKATDGTVHLDAAFGACFHTKDEIEPWWMVDLQGIYIIDRVVIYNKQENAAGVLARNIEISVGIDVAELQVTSFLCGSMAFRKTFDQHNIRGRYVKLQVKHLKQKFHLCEVEVYGVLESEIDEKLKKEFRIPDPVQGNWGNWGSWSNLCYCNGKQPRIRLCDNPSPSFGGRDCVGSNVSFRTCNFTADCNITNVALGKPSSISSSKYPWSNADLATDGYTLQSKLSCFQTKFEYQPWWIIDLQGVFELEKMTVYRRADCCQRRTRNVEISVGVTCDMKVVYSLCGKRWGPMESVTLIGSTARYVKIQLVGINEYLNLCEIEIYGQPANVVTVDSSDMKCGQIEDGQYSTWSQWSDCSEKCGIGKMTRTRLCDNPAPNNGGRNCFGDDTETKNCIGKANCPTCSETFGKCYSLFPKLTNWKQAGFECWTRKMKLVSVRSKEELRFIKYLLRIHRYEDKQPMATFDSVYRNASYYAHLGLYRYSMKDGVMFDMWEDKTPVTFTAWKPGEPSKGNCVRMNYKSFEDINTWESEDCQSVVAEYFICEQQIRKHSILSLDEELPELHDKNWAKIPEQITSTQYTGNANMTKSRHECIPWEKHANDPYSIIWWQPYIDWWMLAETEVEAKNYCRDPAAENFVWCNYQTSGNTTKREECSVEYPVVENTHNFNWRYTGKWNKTYTGKTCQHWNVTFPQGHHTTGYNFPGETINSVRNYCRDPWDSGYLWCYTIEQDVRWELCIVEDNPGDRCLHTHNIYSGHWNKSYSGKECRRWDENEGHLARGSVDLMFPDKTITAAENFCRDPLGNGYLWCYVHESGVTWEPCIFDDIEQLPVLTTSAEGEAFVCRSGGQILQQNVCDEKFDCGDLSDETDCLDTYEEQPLTTDAASFMNNLNTPEAFVVNSHFQCGTNEWISVTARCDGMKDCLDATDESNCSLPEKEISECSSDQFRCDEGDCIHISQVCNFVDDCIGGSDEYCDIDECKKTEYKCNNGQCIPLSDRCNGFPECIDGSDEDFCDNCQTGMAFHCDVVKCIPSRLVCDKHRDCKDGSDEMSCSQQDFISCEQWWEAGYRKSGPYIIGGLIADCDFDSVISRKKMYTIIRNFDILWRDGDGVGYLYTRDTLREEDIRLDEILKRPNYDCVQEVTQSCIHSHKIAAEFDDSQHDSTFKHCECFEMTIRIGKDSKLGYCYSKTTSTVSNNDLIFSYNASLSLYRKIVLKSNKDFVAQGYQVVPGSAVCEYDYNKQENVTTCEGDVKKISSSINCLYDVDAAGYIIGCRSGSHLQNCENHVCQEGTVKCPGSYCIPLRFVCDGEVQCPGGQDEDGCGCEENENEVLLLYDSESTYMQKLDVYNFAKQFSTATNTIRTLSFVVVRPLQDFNLGDIVLQITDTVMQPMVALNRIQECQYNVMAKNFIRYIKLSAEKTRGLIYIQDDNDVSKTLFNTLFGKVNLADLNLTIYRIMERRANDFTEESMSQVSDVFVKRWSILNAMGAEFFPEFCRARTKVKCHNRYKCKWSKMCIPLNQVCDGQTQCKHGDDEQLCNFICPVNCSCIGYIANCSDSGFNVMRLSTISVTTRQLDLSFNNDLHNVLKGSYLDIMVLVTLNLSSCSINEVSRFAFRKIKNLVTLDLSYNSITVIQKQTFSYLKYLRVLRLEGNWDLSTIQPGAFEALSNIHDLNFAGARLTKITADTFSGLVLQSIDLSNNSIEEIEDFAFRNLAVERISFEQNRISLFRKEIFTGVNALQTLRTPAFKFCCIRPTYLPEEGCYPPKDEFSSCEDLMRLSALQTMLWLIGLSALLGNALTILYRLMYDRARLRLGFGIFVTNLAVADFLMGVYLLIIAVADAVFRKRYIFMDDYWRNSAWCNLAGVLSTVSSEASVFFLCLITMDRLFVIKFPFGQVRFNKRKSVICAGVVWFVSIFLAVLPVAYESYFQNKFYTKSGVCIALPLTRDRPPGWVYSVAIFVGLNFATFVLVAFGQWSIFMEIRNVSGGMEKTTAGRKNDLKVARNLLLVVLTDFLCWFPIGVMGMMALNGHVISGDVYAWSAVFILPINSALNPILYTVSSIIGRKTFNPSTDEQSRTEMTKELGTQILNFQRVSRHFSVRRSQTSYESISSILKMDCRLTPTSVIKAVRQLAKCLDVLHNSSLVVGDLNTDTVCLSVNKGKVSGDVRIEIEPRMATSAEDTQGDMFHVGKIVRVLLTKCKQSGD
ncbi:uncharacterized protein LOC123558066 isoform X2 [Mercenaria mercenaria]|uniref:uncharacterized protein LOC123558066 isoform X2 n=1 Tax=Mercenaria mercenaria TaxID=6596 RepID=UPI00234E925A|nr:uncharacterized protein LOC123558066 isoform X2 [Mercenaria mercenaria]